MLNVKVKRREFLTALKRAQAATPKRTVIPILHNVKVTAANGLLTLVGTNTEITLSCACKAKVISKGEACIPPDRVKAFLESAGSEVIALIGRSEKIISIDADRASCNVESMPAKDYPGHSNAVNRRKAKVIVVKNLLSAVNKVAYAVNTEDSRPVLTGVLFRFRKDGIIELVATDGFRMGITHVKYITDHHFKRQDRRDFIVPVEAIRLIQFLKEGNYYIYIRDNLLELHTPEATIEAKCIDGTYPDYMKLIPSTPGEKITLNRAETLNALRHFKGPEYKEKAVRIEKKRGGVKVWSVDDDGHDLCFTVTGKAKTRFAANPEYLRDLVEHVAAEKVTLGVTGEGSPTMVKDKDTLHLVMPMFIKWS